MTDRGASNPLALAVLACLAQRPMHPYEMASTMREQRKDTAVKLSLGSLYSVVGSLQRRGYIEQAGPPTRQGNRPERRTFAITAAGTATLTEWVTDLVREPAAEYPRFAAGLDYLTALPQVDAVAALRSRAEALTAEVERRRAETTTATEKLARHGLGRVYLLEDEYRLAMVQAELGWVRSVLAEFETGALDDDHWHAHHAGESGR
jgi:DNA-binding PadR family transcriptional regulator